MEKKNPVTKETTCAICDFPLSAEAENGWFEYVAKAEHLFLRNIYSESEMKSMEIPDIENYQEILYRIVDLHQHFETDLQDGVINDEIRDYMLEDLGDVYETFSGLRKDIEKIVVPKKHFFHKSHNSSEKIIAFLYSNMIHFCRTTKVKGILISKTSLQILVAFSKIFIVYITLTLQEIFLAMHIHFVMRK